MGHVRDSDYGGGRQLDLPVELSRSNWCDERDVKDGGEGEKDVYGPGMTGSGV